MSHSWLTTGTLLGLLPLLGVVFPPLPTKGPVSGPAQQETEIHFVFPTAAPGAQNQTGPRSEHTGQYSPDRNGDRPPPASDTLRASATTGTPLILSLPPTLNDTPVTRYTVLQGPSLCGVAGRSFTWIPRGTDPGTYDVSLHAHHPDTAPDTLIVQITVEP